MKKGQVATEYMLLVGIVLFITIPIFYYAITNSSQSIRMNEASNVVDAIAKTADTVYALGPGSQDYIQIMIPGGVESISFDRNEVQMKVKIFSDTSDFFAVSKANLTGSISINSGSKHIYIKTLDNETVEIGEL